MVTSALVSNYGRNFTPANSTAITTGTVHIGIGSGLCATAPVGTETNSPIYSKTGEPFGTTAVVEKNDPLPRLVLTVVEYPDEDLWAKLDHAVADFSEMYEVVPGTLVQKSLDPYGWYFTAQSKAPVTRTVRCRSTSSSRPGPCGPRGEVRP